MSKTIDITIAAGGLGITTREADAYARAVATEVRQQYPEAIVACVASWEATEDGCDARGFEDGDDVAEVEVAALRIAGEVWSEVPMSAEEYAAEADRCDAYQQSYA